METKLIYGTNYIRVRYLEKAGENSSIQIRTIGLLRLGRTKVRILTAIDYNWALSNMRVDQGLTFKNYFKAKKTPPHLLCHCKVLLAEGKISEG